MTFLEARGSLTKALPRIELRCGPGLHAIVTAEASAGAELVAVLAGLERPRRGAIRLQLGSGTAGKNPYTTPELRRVIATLLSVEELAPGRSVEESVGRALALHESSLTADAVLQTFGLSLLSARKPGALSRAEQRAVALSLALSLEPVSLFVLHEPFTTSLGRSRVLWTLTERSRDAIVLVVTASLRDARALGGSVLGFSPAGLSPMPAPWDRATGGAELVAAVSDPERLLSALAGGSAENGIQSEARAGGVVLRGADGDELSRELMRASVAASVTITRLLRRTVPAVPGGTAAPSGSAP